MIRTNTHPATSAGRKPSGRLSPHGEHAPDTTKIHQVFTIMVSGNWFGIPIKTVRTVFRVNSITAVPLAPPAIAGLVNVRGEVLTAIHLTSYLGLKTDTKKDGFLLVGIEYNDEAYGLIVDKAGDILDLSESTRILIPAAQKDHGNLTPLPTYRVGDILLPLLDVHTMLASLSRPAPITLASRNN
jgi:purine-binding chemotaxis protein CheW